MASYRVKWQQPKIERAVFNLTRKNARAAGRHVRDEMRKQVNTAGGVSRPGQPPRRQSGKLRKEIKHAVQARQNKKDVTIRVGATNWAFYGVFLEFGRKAGPGKRGHGSSFMAPRPFANTDIVQRAMVTAQRILVGKR